MPSSIRKKECTKALYGDLHFYLLVCEKISLTGVTLHWSLYRYSNNAVFCLHGTDNEAEALGGKVQTTIQRFSVLPKKWCSRLCEPFNRKESGENCSHLPPHPKLYQHFQGSNSTKQLREREYVWDGVRLTIDFVYDRMCLFPHEQYTVSMSNV